MTLVPAYGRDYKSKSQVLADFNAGKDFQIADHFSPDDGRYVNKPQFVEVGCRSVNIRYARLTKVAVVKVS